VLAASGEELFLSHAFDHAKDAGAAQKALAEQQFEHTDAPEGVRIQIQGNLIGAVAPGAWSEFQSALRALA